MRRRISQLTFLYLIGITVVVASPFSQRMTRWLLYRTHPALALGYGAAHDNPDEIQFGLKYGADVNDRSSFAHRTPLMVAAIHGSEVATRCLLENGADPRLIDDKGLTAYRLAVEADHPMVARLLIGESRVTAPGN